MLNIKNVNLDERELIIRGNIFKHALLTMGGFTFLNGALMLSNLYDPEVKFSWIMPLLAALAVLMIEMSYYQIFPISKKTFTALYYLVGIYGIFILAMFAYFTINGESEFFINGKITDDALLLLMGILYTISFIASRLFSRKKVVEE